MVGPCSCGPFNQYCDHESDDATSYQQQYHYYNNSNENTNSSYDYNYNYNYNETDYMYSSFSSTSPYNSSVDCTLSLGTPSTRSTNESTAKSTLHRNKQYSSSSAKAASRRNNNNHGGGSDPLFVRRCSNCDTTTTPLWRNGPRGPKSLCNACGIRFKKEERRAAAMMNTTAANYGAAGGMVDSHHGYHNGSWSHPYDQAPSQMMQYFG